MTVLTAPSRGDSVHDRHTNRTGRLHHALSTTQTLLRGHLPFSAYRGPEERWNSGHRRSKVASDIFLGG